MEEERDDRLQVYFMRVRGGIRLVVRRPSRGEASEAQILTRERFAQIVREAKGTKGLVDGLPATAAAVRRRLKGLRAAFHEPEAELVRVLRVWLLARGYTDWEVEALLEALQLR